MISFEEQAFQGNSLSKTKLLAFGFVADGKDLVYRRQLMNGDLEAIIRVDQSGAVTGRIIDRDLGEDYTAFRSSQVVGSYVGQVRQDYQDLLEEIAQSCSTEQSLTSPQGQRLVTYIQQTFSDSGAQPFAKFPNIYAYRNPYNGKWYALALGLERGKLDVTGEIWSEQELVEQVEVVNVKVAPEEVPDLIKLRGIYPSYHMNKKHWVTLVLDESLADEQVFDLVASSRYLTLPAKVRKEIGTKFTK